MNSDGLCIFTRKTAINYGSEEYFGNEYGHVLMPNQPMAICDKTACNLLMLGRKDIFIFI